MTTQNKVHKNRVHVIEACRLFSICKAPSFYEQVTASLNRQCFSLACKSSFQVVVKLIFCYQLVFYNGLNLLVPGLWMFWIRLFVEMHWNKSINFITPSIWIKKFSTTVLTSLVSPEFVMNSIEESWQHGLHHPERRVHFFQYTHHRIMSLNIFNGCHQGLAGVVSRTLGLLATEVRLKSDGAIGWYNLCSIINITGSYNGIVPYTTIWNVTLLVIKI